MKASDLRRAQEFESKFRDANETLRKLSVMLAEGGYLQGGSGLTIYDSDGNDEYYIDLDVDENNTQQILPFLSAYYTATLRKSEDGLRSLGIDVDDIKAEMQREWAKEDEAKANYCNDCDCSPCECETEDELQYEEPF